MPNIGSSIKVDYKKKCHHMLRYVVVYQIFNYFKSIHFKFF